MLNKRAIVMSNKQVYQLTRVSKSGGESILAVATDPNTLFDALTDFKPAPLVRDLIKFNFTTDITSPIVQIHENKFHYFYIEASNIKIM